MATLDANTFQELKGSLDEAIAALLNVPQVGEVYDQQHSETQMHALLRVQAVRGTISKQEDGR